MSNEEDDFHQELHDAYLLKAMASTVYGVPIKDIVDVQVVEKTKHGGAVYNVIHKEAEPVDEEFEMEFDYDKGQMEYEDTETETG